MNSEKEVRVRVAELMQRQYKARGIRRGEFAKRLGVTDRTVGYWVDGTSLPKADLQHRIEEMFQWPIGSIAAAIADGLSGKPLDEIEIGQVRAVAHLGDVPASDLADELLARLRAADDQVRSLKRELEDARRELAQPDYSLAAHQVEDSMSERWAADAQFSDAQESPES